MKNIPIASVERVAKYIRCLNHLQKKGEEIVSSKKLAEYTKVTPEQVRKDLSYFGKFGKTGTGYNIKKLARRLSNILKGRKTWNVCIIGAGALGTALARYQGFKNAGYNIVALFDNDPEKIGKKIGNAEIFYIKKFNSIIKKKDIKLAIIAVPSESIEEVETYIAKSQIKGVLNFVPVTLNFNTKRKIATIDVDLAQKLYILSYLTK
jgi:redox-sensing transcriptional repressor